MPAHLLRLSKGWSAAGEVEWGWMGRGNKAVSELDLGSCCCSTRNQSIESHCGPGMKVCKVNLVSDVFFRKHCMVHEEELFVERENGILQTD